MLHHCLLDTVSGGCSHNFYTTLLDRPVLSIVHDILAREVMQFINLSSSRHVFSTIASLLS